jgi:hypothetical protein
LIGNLTEVKGWKKDFQRGEKRLCEVQPVPVAAQDALEWTTGTGCTQRREAMSCIFFSGKFDGAGQVPINISLKLPRGGDSRSASRFTPSGPVQLNCIR